MTRYRKRLAKNIERQLEKSDWTPAKKEQWKKEQEVIASLTMEELWHLKFKQVAGLIEGLHISAYELARELELSPPIKMRLLRDERYYQALNVMYDLGVDKKTVETMFVFHSSCVLSCINDLRFNDLIKLISYTYYPAPKQALFVYRFPVRDVLRYYEASKERPELLGGKKIVNNFFDVINVPYVIVSEQVVRNRKALRGYFYMQRFLMCDVFRDAQEFLASQVFHFGLKRLLNEETKDSFGAFPSDPFIFYHLASGVVGDYLWLFFNATKLN